MEKKKKVNCEYCGRKTTFTLNCCEDCFDRMTDYHYDGGRDDL